MSSLMAVRSVPCRRCALSIADDHGQDADADPEALTERLEFIAELPRTPPGIEIS